MAQRSSQSQSADFFEKYYESGGQEFESLRVRQIFLENLAGPTRFERVTFAFGGQRSGAQTISWSGRMYARRLSQAAKRNALQRRCEIDPLSGTSCTSVDDNHMSLPRVELDNINQPDDRRLKPARLP